MNRTQIRILAHIDKPVDQLWILWTEPAHILKWNHANEDWQTTKAESDLRVGGQFSSRMEAKDGSMGFDFSGVFTMVVTNQRIVYSLEDGRRVVTNFYKENGKTTLEQIFEAEEINPIDMQKAGWQAILNNFKKYAESQ